MRHGGLKWDATEKRKPFTLCERRAATFAEDGMRMTVLAGERAHVFDHAENVEVTLPRHRDSTSGNALCANRWCSHDNHFGLREHSCKSHLHVTGARWKVDHDVVEITRPRDVFKKMLHRAIQDEAAPHQCIGFVVDEETHRHDIESAGPDRNRLRNDCAIVVRTSGCFETPFNAEHARNGESPNVGVDDADCETAISERSRKVRGDGGLSDTALSRRNGEHPRTRRDAVRTSSRLRVLSSNVHCRGLLFRVHLDPIDGGRGDPGQTLDAGEDLAFELRLEWTPGGGERHNDDRLSRLGDRGRAGHSQFHDVGAELRIDNAAEGSEDLVAGGKAGHGGNLPARAAVSPARRGILMMIPLPFFPTPLNHGGQQ